jgi:hypothetical protein
VEHPARTLQQKRGNERGPQNLRHFSEGRTQWQELQE